VLPDQAAARPPVGKRVEIEAQQARLRPRSLLQCFDVLAASSAAGTERIDNGVRRAVAEPVPRECEAVGRNLPEPSSRCQLLKLRHLLWAQPARQHVEIVNPQEILRAGMMARPVDEREQQRVDVVGGRRRGTEGVNAHPAAP
jgi:hypothetical protein